MHMCLCPSVSVCVWGLHDAGAVLQPCLQLANFQLGLASPWWARTRGVPPPLENPFLHPEVVGGGPSLPEGTLAIDND